jgi:ankyrin repeat protein
MDFLTQAIDDLRRDQEPYMQTLDWDQHHMWDKVVARQSGKRIDLHEVTTSEEAQALINIGYDINQRTEVTLSTPLIAACKKGRIEVVKYLLQFGCDSNLATMYGESPLHIAVIINSEQILLALIKSGAITNPINHSGQTLLLTCVQTHSEPNLLPLLLEYTHNDDINKQDNKGRSALRSACRLKKVSADKEDYEPSNNVQLLLERGADPNIVCMKGRSPLHIATYGQFPTTIKTLLHFGANIDAKTIEDGQTALHIASENDSLDIIHILIDAGSDMNTTDIHGYTLLHNVRKLENLQYLLTTPTIGLINARTVEGHTPLHVMVNRYNSIDMIQSLVNADADIYATDNNGQSCLHTTCIQAIARYRLITIQKLVDVGVDIILKDNIEKTALQYLHESDTECRKYLQESVDNCTTNPGFKRANMNTDSDNDEEEEDNMGVDEIKT